MEKDNLENRTKTGKAITSIREKLGFPLFCLSFAGCIGLGIHYNIEFKQARAQTRIVYEGEVARYQDNPTPEMTESFQRVLYENVTLRLGKRNRDGHPIFSDWEKAFKKAGIEYKGEMPPHSNDLSVPQLMKIFEEQIYLP
ncbi:MAG: hypothetical protein KKF46_00705 [Nanoarchaeota archaeon]|nr:hypothetical protein [Nanoarchaeota archaeon]MBU1320853.1 hypothetical protein [Nanoarchaeota archaeon]MBU1597919.1 hypothetical protein [Nanoarchaeota archaeon]MBU2441345.1 hypothetical protein [Nanoarchaeota archaeon]